VRLLRKRCRRAYRVFFATDVHGSDRCFRKFVAASRVYEADALILGGDIAGKAIVPITDDGHDRFTFVWRGIAQEVAGAELAQAKALINFSGDYALVCESRAKDRLAEDSVYREELFEQVIASQLQQWCELARERLNADVRCIITPGNDDPWSIDDVLAAEAPRIECPERAVVELGPIRLASLGNTNRTPWDTPREYNEEEFWAQIVAMFETYGDEQPLVLNFHCPPYDSNLDTAAILDSKLRPVVQHGAILTGPVGSTAVRKAIERYQPTVGLHGHIHEAKGTWRSGGSVCLNPGSDYGSGLLRGVIVDFDEHGCYCDHLFTAG
jgi:uncharacterized protein